MYEISNPNCGFGCFTFLSNKMKKLVFHKVLLLESMKFVAQQRGRERKKKIEVNHSFIVIFICSIYHIRLKSTNIEQNRTKE